MIQVHKHPHSVLGHCVCLLQVVCVPPTTFLFLCLQNKIHSVDDVDDAVDVVVVDSLFRATSYILVLATDILRSSSLSF